jgi:hypothetical protein
MGWFDCSISLYSCCPKHRFRVSPGTPVYSTNKTDLHDIAEIVLKVALNTTTQAQDTISIRTFSHPRYLIILFYYFVIVP